jgi:hypothetical protein
VDDESLGAPFNLYLKASPLDHALLFFLAQKLQNGESGARKCRGSEKSNKKRDCLDDVIREIEEASYTYTLKCLQLITYRIYNNLYVDANNGCVISLIVADELS